LPTGGDDDAKASKQVGAYMLSRQRVP
jgi:hypothetical protein